jgi:hypothetical protein
VLLYLLPLAAAAPAPVDLPTVQPFAWVRPGFTWIADDPAIPTGQDGFMAEARIGVLAVMPHLPVSAKIELELLPEPQLTDAVVTVAPTSWASVRLGQLKVPFSVHTQTSDTRRQLPPEIQFLKDAKITRQIGAAVDLALPIGGRTRATYTSGVFNGEGPNRIQNVNQRYQFAQRLLITPFGTRDAPFEGTSRALYVGVGGGWLYDYAGESDTAVESNTYGVELQAAWNVLSVQAEAVQQDLVHANAAVTDYSVRGCYGQLGAFVPAPWVEDHLELVGRFELDEPNTAFGADAGEALPAFQATRRIVGGVNVYVRKAPERFHDLKVQLAYANVVALEGEDLADDSFTVNGTARF